MDLIERYVAAVVRNLPAKHAGDIAAELRDVLLSRVEEREAKLGRPLDPPQVEALLVEFGNPLLVAGRYRKTQHLIGPSVFPFWWATIKVVGAILGGVYLVLIVLGVLLHKTSAEFNHSAPIAPVLVFLFGAVTLVFAAIERFGGAASLQRWKPRHLPPAAGKPRSRFELAAEITWNVVFLAWWLGLFRARDYLPYEAFLTVDLAPVWTVWRWAIVSYIVLDIAAAVLAIARPGWVWINGIGLIVRYLYGIAILSQIVQAGHWLTVFGATIPPHALAEIQTNFDLGMKAGIGLTILGMAMRIGLEAWRLRRVRQASEGVPRLA
ncbi:MAG: hypothetical protein ACJ798_04130 [Phenylobacterium sp.]